MLSPVDQMFQEKKVFKKAFILMLIVLLPAIYPIAIEIVKHEYQNALDLLEIVVYIDFGILVGTFYTKKLLNGVVK